MKTHPYRLISFWKNKQNWFWERDQRLTEEARQYYRSWVKNLLNVPSGHAHKLDD